ncbi:retrovirus-related pol polyprotein from transposon TNT 1-94 [Tanacetum coccineum]
MHDEFEMSMMGELNFFLGLQIKQMEDGIFFNQSKYIKEMLKKFGLEDSKPMKTPMSSDTKLTKDEDCESVDSTKYRGMIGTTHLGLWYPKGTDIETVVYADSDHAGDYVDRKRTSGIYTFVGCCLTSWFSKKQTALAISTTEAEYVSAEKACQQALWMKQALIDYDRLDELAYGIPSDGPYQTNLLPIEDIISSIRIDREGQVRRIRHEEEIDVLEYQILTREIVQTLKPLEEIIWENVFCLGVTTIPSPTTTSSTPTPPNAPLKTPSTNQTSSSQDNTPSSFQSKLQISPPSSIERNSPQSLNPLLENILDVSPRPLNPQPIQSLPSLDITLSLSPITPLENLSSPPSPSPPPPQPPIMGHPLYYNYHDYHGSTCICCFHNRNLHLNLRDEMNIMFAHLKYLLTTAFTTYFSPQP